MEDTYMPNGDRISPLPDEIIHHILSFMPMDSAIRTGTLSHRWLHLWKFSPVIEFPSLPVSLSFNEPIDYNFLNRCLDLYRSSKIQKLTIYADVVSFNSHPDIKSLVNFAVLRQVQFLKVDLYTNPPGIISELPNSIYLSNHNIQNMQLHCVEFIIPPVAKLGFKGYPVLKKLSLSDCGLNDETLKAILSNCLVLEILELKNCLGLVNVKVSSVGLKEFVYYQALQKTMEIEIDAPCLVRLKMVESLKLIRLKNSCGGLKNVTLFNFIDFGDVDMPDVRRLLCQLSQIEFFGADRWFLKVLEKEYTDGNRFDMFKNIKGLFWCFVPLKEQIPLFLTFLADCPSLVKIQIDFRFSCWEEPHKFMNITQSTLTPSLNRPKRKITYSTKDIDIGKLFLHEVKTIELCYYMGYEYQTEMVKHLLEMAVNLERVYLIFEEPNNPAGTSIQVNRELMLEQVSLLPRASTNARFLFG